MCCGFSENRPLLSISLLPPSPRPWCFVAHTGLPASCSPVSSPQPPQQPGPGLRNTSVDVRLPRPHTWATSPAPRAGADLPGLSELGLSPPSLPLRESQAPVTRARLAARTSPQASGGQVYSHMSASRSGREGGVCASLPRSSLFGFIASQHEGRKRAGPEDRRTYTRHLRGARIINQHVRPKTRADGGGPSFDYTPPRAPRKFCYF